MPDYETGTAEYAATTLRSPMPSTPPAPDTIASALRDTIDQLTTCHQIIDDLHGEAAAAKMHDSPGGAISGAQTARALAYSLRERLAAVHGTIGML